jgi:hypothetical protein
VVLAIDGSRAEISNSRENRKAYGESENRYGKGVARVNISGAYDVYNGFLLDIEDGGGEEDIQEMERDGGTGIWDNKTGDGVPAISVAGA